VLLYRVRNKSVYTFINACSSFHWNWFWINWTRNDRATSVLKSVYGHIAHPVDVNWKGGRQGRGCTKHKGRIHFEQNANAASGIGHGYFFLPSFRPRCITLFISPLFSSFNIQLRRTNCTQNIRAGCQKILLPLIFYWPAKSRVRRCCSNIGRCSFAFKLPLGGCELASKRDGGGETKHIAAIARACYICSKQHDRRGATAFIAQL
jgi:hypothetical protein